MPAGDDTAAALGVDPGSPVLSPAPGVTPPMASSSSTPKPRPSPVTGAAAFSPSGESDLGSQRMLAMIQQDSRIPAAPRCRPPLTCGK